MTPAVDHPWQREPAQLIAYALEHLHREGEFEQRIAFLLLDVGVETLFKTFLTLPDRVTAPETKYHDRKEAAEGSFHKLVSGVQAAAISRLDPVDLNHVEYYHSLRNKLYHHGDGINVAADNAKGYAETAVKLLKALLDVDLAYILEKPDVDRQVQEALEGLYHGARAAAERAQPNAYEPDVISQLEGYLRDGRPEDMTPYIKALIVDYFGRYNDPRRVWTSDPDTDEPTDMLTILARSQDVTELYLRLLEHLDLDCLQDAYDILEVYMLAKSYQVRAANDAPVSRELVKEGKTLALDLATALRVLQEFADERANSL
jgi:hypothetical protein